MTSFKYLWVSILAAALLLGACGGGEEESSGEGKRDGRAEDREEQRDPLVEVVPATRDNISESERSTGRIEARELADVYAQVTEVARDVLVEVGDRVTKGQILARLDREKLELAVASSMIAVQESELAHRKNQLDAEKRRTDLARIEKYFNPKNPEDSTLFSKDAYDAAKLEHDKAVNTVQTSSLALTKIQGELATAQLQLSNTIIKAPIDGIVTERNIRRNELVSASALVFRIADFHELEVSLDVAEGGLQSMREPERIPAVSLFGLAEKVRLDTAQAVVLSVTAFQNERFLGFVDRISPTVEETRGMIVVTVRIVQPDQIEPEGAHAPLLAQIDHMSRAAVMATAQRAQAGANLQLRPGMWVDARISTNVRKDVMLVPGAAIVGDAEIIWVVTSGETPETGIVRRVDISRRRGVSSEGAFELLPAPEGADETQLVKDGEFVVVRGQSLLRDKQKVRVRDLTS